MKRLLGVGAAALAMALTAGTAAAASATPCRSGTEVIVGSTHNLANVEANVPVVPLTAYGVVHSKGSIALGGSGNGTGTLDFRAGTLAVKHTQTGGGTQPTLNPRTCVYSLSQGGVYKVLSGTGKFSGATGRGQFKVYFALKAPRLKNGKCNTSQSAQPVSGVIRFLAYGPLSVG